MTDKYNPDQFELIGISEQNGHGMSGGVWQGGDPKPRIDGGARYTRLFIRRRP